MPKRIKRLLCLWFPRYKLHCILRALDLKPEKWQIDFALRRSYYMPGYRNSGKTMAVMLKALMLNPTRKKDPEGPELEYVMRWDPDYLPGVKKRVVYYRREYDILSAKCKAAGIPVPETLFSATTGDWTTNGGLRL